MAHNSRTVLVTGGAGYVGAVLVPRLLAAGHEVRVLDLYLYGEDVLDAVKDHPRLQQIQGDLRDQALLAQALRGCDSVIHLACISNDPSFELNPALGRSINYDAFGPLVDLSKAAGVRRFIYASSSSVYGLKDEPEVTEDLPLEPLTDYSRYKALCEEILVQARARGFEVVILRPATVCGYSPRQRLDLIVNIFTAQAITRSQIDVWGARRVGRISTSRRWPSSTCAAWRHLPSRSMARLSMPAGPTTPLPRSPALCGMRSASKSGLRPRTATTYAPTGFPPGGSRIGLGLSRSAASTKLCAT